VSDQGSVQDVKAGTRAAKAREIEAHRRAIKMHEDAVIFVRPFPSNRHVTEGSREGWATRSGRYRGRASAVRRLRPLCRRSPVSEIGELGVRDGSNLTVEGYEFAPSFSIWTTIEECLNPPVIWEADRGWYVTPPFSEPEVFDFPGGIGPVECVNVEHEEVLLMPRWINAKRVKFKYGSRRRVHRRTQDAAQARSGQDRASEREGRPGLAAGRRGCVPS
jgi:hypothetical protein